MFEMVAPYTEVRGALVSKFSAPFRITANSLNGGLEGR